MELNEPPKSICLISGKMRLNLSLLTPWSARVTTMLVIHADQIFYILSQSLSESIANKKKIVVSHLL